MGVEVFRAPLYRRFLADRLTCGYVLALLFQVTVVVLPFFLAYTSEGFWMKSNTFREMPKVSFQYQAMMSAGIKSSDNTDVEIQKVNYALKPESLELLEESMTRTPLAGAAERALVNLMQRKHQNRYNCLKIESILTFTTRF